MYFEADLKIMHKSRHKSQRERVGFNVTRGFAGPIHHCVPGGSISPSGDEQPTENSSTTCHLGFLEGAEPRTGGPAPAAVVPSVGESKNLYAYF